MSELGTPSSGRHSGITRGDLRAEILTFEDVTVGYGASPVLEGVTFNVRRGEVAGVVALDGRGRSTLIKCAGGLLAPTAGKVHYENRDVYRMGFREDQKFRARSSMVLEGGALLVNRSIFENVALPLRYHLAMKDDDLETFVGRLLKRVGYTESADALPWQVSTRGRKLAAFARALVREPELVFVDRFFEGLEPPDVKRIMELVLELNVKNGTSFLIVGELTPQIFQVAERVVVLEGGKVVAQDFKRALFKIEKIKKAFEEGESAAAERTDRPAETSHHMRSGVMAAPLLTDSAPFEPDADSDEQPVVVLEPAAARRPKKPRKSSPSLSATIVTPAPLLDPDGAPDTEGTANLSPEAASAIVRQIRDKSAPPPRRRESKIHLKPLLEESASADSSSSPPKTPRGAETVDEDMSERTVTLAPGAQDALLAQIRARAEERLEAQARATESGSSDAASPEATASEDIHRELEEARAAAEAELGGSGFTERPTREFEAPTLEEDSSSAPETRPGDSSSGASGSEEK